MNYYPYYNYFVSQPGSYNADSVSDQMLLGFMPQYTVQMLNPDMGQMNEPSKSYLDYCQAYCANLILINQAFCWLRNSSKH